MKFIHISDLHYNPKKDGRTSDKMRTSLVKYLTEQKITADELLITGDFRYAPDQGKDVKDIDEVVKYIKDIASSVGIQNEEHIHVVPGNHDRDRAADKAETERFNRIRAGYDPDKGTFEDEDKAFLLSKFDYFQLLCSRLYGSKNYWPVDELHCYRVLNNTVFLYLNTAIMHNDNDDRKESRLIIGNDCFYRLLNDIEKKNPDLPVIILAHHSPDMFTKHEKEAVEDIIKSHKQVSLYLCGDSHECWPRKVNFCVEITLGSLKQETGAEGAFLYGDTDIQEYKMYHWAKAWEPYNAYTDALQDFFGHDSNDNNKSIEMPFTIDISVDDDRKITNESEVKKKLLLFMTKEDGTDVQVNLDSNQGNAFTKLYNDLLEKINTGVELTEKEEKEFKIIKNGKTREEKINNRNKLACELFLRDTFAQKVFYFNEVKDYLYVLSEIVGYDPARFGSPSYFDNIKGCFTVRCTNNKDFYFYAYIPREDLKKLGGSEECNYQNILLTDIYSFEYDTAKSILIQYYLDLAMEAQLRNPEILTDEKAMNIGNYRFLMD